jgi:hypothetical protein
MTKVQLDYDLVRPLDDKLLERIARAHSTYGILRVSLAEGMNKITVEYDASRLSPLEVENLLHRLGIPIVLHV